MLSLQKLGLGRKPIGLLVILCGVLFLLNRPGQAVIAQQPTPQPPAPSCDARLPTIKFLGDGPGTFTMEDGFETFIVKRVRPFRFTLESGDVNDQGKRTYTVAARERIWICDKNCELPAVYEDFYPIGNFQPGQTINLVVIDDDDDARLNYLAVDDPLTPYQVVEEQGMVQYVTFDVPQAGAWYYYAADSIGIASVCIEATPTATASPGTPTATDTVTQTPTATASPATPAATDTATQTPTAPATPTGTSTSTPTPPIDTDTPTPTPISLPTGEGTPTPTPVVPPTAIELLYLEAAPHPSGVELRWETAIELDFVGFHLWRSTDAQRQTATLLTPTLIARRGGGSSGATYTFVDADVTVGQTYTYWLEKVHGDGTVEDMRATLIQLRTILYLPFISR